MVYFSEYLTDEAKMNESTGFSLTLKISCYVLTSLFILVEVTQFKDAGWKEYFSSITNLLDTASALINLIILVKSELKHLDDIQNGLILVAVLLVWWKVFYWMRLFESTAFFYKLLQ